MVARHSQHRVRGSDHISTLTHAKPEERPAPLPQGQEFLLRLPSIRPSQMVLLALHPLLLLVGAKEGKLAVAMVIPSQEAAVRCELV